MVRVRIGTVKVTKPTPTPTPPTPTPPKPTTPTEWFDRHVTIRRKVLEYAKIGKCITPSMIAKDLNLDVDTVKTHLEVMSVDKGAVKVADVQGEGVYCISELINKMIEDLKKLE